MSRTVPIDEDAQCPCGSGVRYSLCCADYLHGRQLPRRAEQLMRSRYCAFVLCDEPYLLATWHADTRPGRVRFDPGQRWLGLGIRSTDAGGVDDSLGTVEFVARYKIEGKGHRLHEVSRFERIDGRWYYLDGQHL